MKTSQTRFLSSYFLAKLGWSEGQLVPGILPSSQVQGAMEGGPALCPASWACSQTCLAQNLQGEALWPLPGEGASGQAAPSVFPLCRAALTASHFLGSSTPEVHCGAKNRLCLDTLKLRLETRKAINQMLPFPQREPLGLILVESHARPGMEAG